VIVYIDHQYKCHVADGEGLVAIETDAFDGKCTTFIEGYRFVPASESWTREDGTVFTGEMVAPWKPYADLDAAQRTYEREQYEAARAAYAALDEGLTSV